LGTAKDAGAQEAPAPPPERDDTWATVTTITMATAGATQLLMPRIFYSDPEVTVGWKGRWHVSQLAPVMFLTGLTLFSELALKPAFKGGRPGCTDENQGGPNCETFGMPSTHSFGSFAALGHGVGVFIFDTTKWSQGKINGGALAGNVIVPLVLAGITAIGRGVGDWEDTGSIIAGGGVGVALGFLTGMTYSLMARPECGYTGNLICW
jgi:hypothetical protein